MSSIFEAMLIKKLFPKSTIMWPDYGQIYVSILFQFFV